MLQVLQNELAIPILPQEALKIDLAQGIQTMAVSHLYRLCY
jgi:hypothetical protein